MGDTTNIFDLPTDPVGGGNISNNISLSASENINIQPQMQSTNGQVSLDQTTISQIVNGLQQASATGVTQLPSRDIPMTTTGLTQDPYVQVNYVPPPKSNEDYIGSYENNQEMIDSYNKNTQQGNSLDNMYNEIQTPLLLGVLFFLFQLPIFKKIMFTYFPALFSKDGNANIYGFIFNSVLFGVIFYVLNKVTSHFNAF